MARSTRDLDILGRDREDDPASRRTAELIQPDPGSDTARDGGGLIVSLGGATWRSDDVLRYERCVSCSALLRAVTRLVR
jgi:hypothetical protein